MIDFQKNFLASNLKVHYLYQSSSDNNKFDKLGRPHFGTPYSGPTVITLRAQKFFSATIKSHSNDLYPRLEAEREQGKTCCFLMVDGGPDYQTKSLLNELFDYRIWKKLDLDLLGAFCYPARESAYNCIEHFWSIGSKALAGVVFSATLPGEDLPPARQLISEKERKVKEAKLSNNAMDKLCNDYWKDISFDKFKVQSYPVHCKESFVDNAIFNDHTAVKNFLAAPLRDYHKFKDIQNEFKHMLRHIDRHANEVIFMKCSDPSCCKEWEAKDVYRFLCKQGLRLPAPKMSKTHPGHYMTFMEVSALSKEETVNGDSGKSSVEKANLGKCNLCPAYCYSSKTDMQRHHKIMHRGAKDNREGQPTKKAVADCSFACPVAECGESFSSQSALQRHRQKVGHTKRQLKRKPNACDGSKKQTVMDMLAKKRFTYVEAAKNDQDMNNEKDDGSESEEEAGNVLEDDQVESSSQEEDEEECSAKKVQSFQWKACRKEEIDMDLL